MTSFVILIQNNSNNHKTQAHPFKNKDFKIIIIKKNPTSLSLFSVTFQHY